MDFGPVAILFAILASMFKEQDQDPSLSCQLTLGNIDQPVKWFSCLWATEKMSGDGSCRLGQKFEGRRWRPDSLDFHSEDEGVCLPHSTLRDDTFYTRTRQCAATLTHPHWETVGRATTS